MTRFGVFMGLIGAAAGAILPLADQSQAFWQLECPVYPPPPPQRRCDSNCDLFVRSTPPRTATPSSSFGVLTPHPPPLARSPRNKQPRLGILARPVLSRRCSTRS